MSTLTDKNDARQILAAFTQLDIKPPAAVAAAYERTTRISAGTQNLAPKDEDLYHAVTSALDGRRDPAADEEVQRILTAAAIANQGVMMGVETILYDQLRNVVTEHADQIMTALAKHFEAAATTLTAAHQTLGNVPLEDTATIVRKGGDAAKIWGQAQQAVAVVNTTLSGWISLAALTRLAPNHPRYAVLRLAPVTFEQWGSLELTERKISPWEAVLLRLPLALPTFEQYHQRVETIEQGNQRIAQHAEQDRQAYLAGRRPPVHAN